MDRAIKKELRRLEKKQRDVVRFRFFGPMVRGRVFAGRNPSKGTQSPFAEFTLQETGELMGMGREGARLHEEKAMRRLRSPKRRANLETFLD